MDSGVSQDTKAFGRYLTEHLEGFSSPHELREFSAGSSNPTFLLSTEGFRAVLRRRPAGTLATRAHAIDREFRVLKALYPTGFPVPRPLLYCDRPEVMGAEFYVMEHVVGRLFADFSLAEIAPLERDAVYDSMNVNLAQLHSLDLNALGLNDFGGASNYFVRQANVWQRSYSAQSLKLARFEQLAKWVENNAIEDGRRCLIHGDFVLWNILIHPSKPEITAVLDWELSTIGHPLADLAHTLMYWYLPTIPRFGFRTLEGIDLRQHGIPSVEEFVRRYAERMGRPILTRDLNYAMAFSFFRYAGIAFGALARAQQGTAKNDLAAAGGDVIGHCLDLGWTFARKADNA